MPKSLGIVGLIQQAAHRDETDDPLQLRIRQLLYEMEFAETRQMVGPSPESRFPQFLG